MMTRRPLYLTLLFLAVGLAGLLGGRPLLAAASFVSVACALLLGWRAARAEMARRLADETGYEWLSTPPVALPEVVRLEEEWSALGYERLGTLRSRRSGTAILRTVFRHSELPVWAWVESGAGSDAVACATTFFEGGGRVLTTSVPTLDAAALACLGSGNAPWLVQLRAQGRPLALDGQHVGTVRAWSAGKRRALPVVPDKLVPALQEERRQFRQHLESGRGLTFADYLRALLGRPRGVLTF